MNRIFLIGFMGSGKSALGKRLAKRLQLPFIDLDVLIEQKLQQSISEIFQLKGEDFFRQTEQQALSELIASKQEFVLACGGGTPIYADNMLSINAAGKSIFLDVPDEILLGRLRQNRNKRPLLAQLNDDELRRYVVDTINERRPTYEKAQYIIQETNPTVDELISLLKN